jgi:glutathione synthase/RimK-type ligase-like ATP-grasp enzyme
MILIITQSEDPHADIVEKKLQQRQVKYLRFNPAQFPSQAQVSISSSKGKVQHFLHVDDKSFDLNELKAIWYRRPEPSVPQAEITDRLDQEFIGQECNIFLQDLWNSLNCLVMPAPYSVIRRAELKASQLKLAVELGFEIPPTLITNSPNDFLEFYNQHNGRIISKLAGRPFLGELGKTFMRFTEVVSQRDVVYAQGVRYCPVIFQAYIPKHLELRITVVGKRVFAAEIHSQTTNHTRHDWRHYDDLKTPYFPHELPQDVQQHCIELVEKLGLCYGAIDMIITPDGRYIFLEINPNGQYLWVENATGMPISDAICDLLISGLASNKLTKFTF